MNIRYKITALMLLVIAGMIHSACVTSKHRHIEAQSGAPWTHDEERFFRYPVAEVTRVIDGDTFVAKLYFGFGMYLDGHIRLADCDTFKKHKDLQKWAEAKTLTIMFLNNPPVVIHSTGKRDSFGRILGDVSNRDGEFLSEVLKKKKLTTGRYK